MYNLYASVDNASYVGVAGCDVGGGGVGGNGHGGMSGGIGVDGVRGVGSLYYSSSLFLIIIFSYSLSRHAWPVGS